MKLLAFTATVPAVVGFGTVASACDGTKRGTTTPAQQGDGPVWPSGRQG